MEAQTKWHDIQAESDMTTKLNKVKELQRYAHKTVIDSIGNTSKLFILEGKLDRDGNIVGPPE